MNYLNQIFRGLFAALLFLVASLGFAAQKVGVEDGGSYVIKVSANELSRLTVERGRIEKVWSVNTAWDVKADKESGELFVRPRDGARKAFSFFVKDSFGNTYTLIATPYDIPSETVMLQPKRRAGAALAKRDALAEQPYLQQLKTIIKDMVAGHFEPYLCEEVNQEVPLWKETKITLAHQCESFNLEADVYRIANVSGKELVMSEREFAGFGVDVQAVALDRLVLQPEEWTTLYIVRGLQ